MSEASARGVHRTHTDDPVVSEVEKSIRPGREPIQDDRTCSAKTYLRSGKVCRAFSRLEDVDMDSRERLRFIQMESHRFSFYEFFAGGGMDYAFCAMM